MKPKILVVGSSNTDMIVKTPRIPKPGETILGGEFVTAAGGKGANQAVGAARAGGDVTFVARVGNDMFGARAIAGFVRDRIKVDYVFRDRRTPSGVALIFVAEDGQNSIAVASGANAQLSGADVRRAARAFATAQNVLLQLETPLSTVVAAAKLAAKHDVPVILNPAPAQPLPDALLRRVSILTPNETEAELLTGIKVTSESAAARAAERLRLRGVQTVVITLGVRGAFVADVAGSRRVPGFKVKPVDTTAAGDIFNGALAVALAELRSSRGDVAEAEQKSASSRRRLRAADLDQAVRFAHAAAAISVTRLGAQPSAPTRREIERFLEQHR